MVTKHQKVHTQSYFKFTERDVIECGGRAFEVSDGRGQVLFSVAREAVRVAADSLVVEGVGGVTVKNSVQTPLVRAPPGADLE